MLPESFLQSAFRLLGLTLLFMALSCSTGCKKEPAAIPARVQSVSVQTVARQDIPLSFEFVAQTQSSQLVNIHARISGFLEKRVYTEGSRVEKGQILFLIDPKPFEAQLGQARAALAMQKAAFETARLNLDRTQPLVAQRALAQKDLDDASGQYQSAAAAQEQAAAQVETARLNLSYTTIRAPVTGISGAAQQAEGTYISAQNSLLTTVAVLSPMWVNFSLSEHQLQEFRNQIAKGLLRPAPEGNFAAEIILTDGSVHPHRGRISFADPSYNSQTGTFLLRVSVDNPDGTLRPNQFVRVRLTGAVRPDAVLIPQRAVQQGPRGHFVWLVDQESKAEQRPVKMGDWHAAQWFVFEGLAGGERVIVDGVMALRPGMPVKIESGAHRQP